MGITCLRDAVFLSALSTVAMWYGHCQPQCREVGRVPPLLFSSRPLQSLTFTYSLPPQAAEEHLKHPVVFCFFPPPRLNKPFNMSSCLLLNSAPTLSSPATCYHQPCRSFMCIHGNQTQGDQKRKSNFLNLFTAQVLFNVKFDVKEFRWRKYERVRWKRVHLPIRSELRGMCGERLKLIGSKGVCVCVCM